MGLSVSASHMIHVMSLHPLSSVVQRLGLQSFGWSGMGARPFQNAHIDSKRYVVNEAKISENSTFVEFPAVHVVSIHGSTIIATLLNGICTPNGAPLPINGGNCAELFSSVHTS